MPGLAKIGFFLSGIKCSKCYIYSLFLFKTYNLFKFIGAALGFVLLGRNFFGAFIGFIIGSVIDNYATIGAQAKSQGGGSEDVFDYYRRQASRSHEDFATMLIALSAAVMKADGRPLKVEL